MLAIPLAFASVEIGNMIGGYLKKLKKKYKKN